jgi:hypothetical protein
MVNTSAFRGTNIETGKRWSLGAFSLGPRADWHAFFPPQGNIWRGDTSEGG